MKKIMFNDKYGLKQAVLEGRKTQTRRIANKQNFVNPFFATCLGRIHINEIFKDGEISRYAIGEEVAVAQSYYDIEQEFINHKIHEYPFSEFPFGEAPINTSGWKNKMFVKAKYMPHRIKITDIRVERLQDISDEDCLKEGIKRKNERYCVENQKGVCFYTNDPKLAFRCLIDKTCGKGTWESNPWVFVYDFELVK